LRFCGDNEHDSRGEFEYCRFLREDQSLAPHLNPLPASGERRDI
jgi:hypothetical protein